MRVLMAILCLLVATCLRAHSIHTSTAEAEYNAKTKKLEVSLTVFVSDLELALVRQSEREMKIEKTPAAEFDAQTQAYLAKTFVVTDAAGKVAKMAWVGREMEKASEKSGDPAVVLFFEVEVPVGVGVGVGVQGAMVRNAVFFDLFKDQMNLLQLRKGMQKSELRFVRDAPVKSLSFSN